MNLVKQEPFSVLMSVHAGEHPDYLEAAIRSIVDQSYLPSEVVIVADGPLTTALWYKLNNLKEEYSVIKVYELKENQGLGKALHFGLMNCSFELVARMDSDDICLPRRFEWQIPFLVNHSDVSVCGCQIMEFKESIEESHRVKKVPLGHEEVKIFARLRNPLNHPTVVFRKSHVLAVGSYKDMPLFEDYYLWLRLLRKDYKIVNLDKALLYFRMNNMLSRRQGIGYLEKEWQFFRRIRLEGLIARKNYFLLVITRLPFRLLPKQLLGIVYTLFLRKNSNLL